MRPKRDLFVNSLKANNIILNGSSITVSGGSGSSGTNVKHVFDDNSSNVSISIPITGTTSMINFINTTYSNESSEYDIKYGAILNIDTISPNIVFYNSFSNLDLSSISLGSKTSSNIQLELNDNSFFNQLIITSLENPVYCELHNNFFLFNWVQNKYYKSNTNTEINNPFELGVHNNNVKFIYRYPPDSEIYNSYLMEFNSYNFSNNGNNNSLSFSKFIKAIKNPEANNGVGDITFTTLNTLKEDFNFPVNQNYWSDQLEINLFNLKINRNNNIIDYCGVKTTVGNVEFKLNPQTNKIVISPEGYSVSTYFVDEQNQVISPAPFQVGSYTKRVQFRYKYPPNSQTYDTYFMEFNEYNFDIPVNVYQLEFINFSRAIKNPDIYNETGSEIYNTLTELQNGMGLQATDIEYSSEIILTDLLIGDEYILNSVTNYEVI